MIALKNGRMMWFCMRGTQTCVIKWRGDLIIYQYWHNIGLLQEIYGDKYTGDLSSQSRPRPYFFKQFFLFEYCALIIILRVRAN